MSNDIAGIPFFKAEFDEQGAMQGSAPNLPADATDVYVISHGWNNSATEASDLYAKLFTNFKAVAPPGAAGVAKNGDRRRLLALKKVRRDGGSAGRHDHRGRSCGGSQCRSRSRSGG